MNNTLFIFHDALWMITEAETRIARSLWGINALDEKTINGENKSGKT